jgi:hypothetical protein
MYGNQMSDGNVTDNMNYHIGCDDMMFSQCFRMNIKRNWGSRVKYPKWSGDVSPNDPIDHADFIQMSNLSYASFDLVIEGNIIMRGVWPGVGANNTQQGIFGDGANSTQIRMILRDNIILNNHFHGISFAGAAGGASSSNSGVEVYNNSAIHMTGDATASGADRMSSIITSYGVSAGANNYMSKLSNQGTYISLDSLYAIMSANNYTAGLVYYTNISPTSNGFYDLRPVTGQPTHWAYTGGTKKGAWQRFYDVIVGKVVPNVGRAAYYWQLMYDPNGDIVSL